MLKHIHLETAIAEIETQTCLPPVTHVNHTHFSAIQAETSKREGLKCIVNI